MTPEMAVFIGGDNEGNVFESKKVRIGLSLKGRLYEQGVTERLADQVESFQ